MPQSTPPHTQKIIDDSLRALTVKLNFIRIKIGYIQQAITGRKPDQFDIISPPPLDLDCTKTYTQLLQDLSAASGFPPRFFGLENSPLHCYDNGYYTIVAESLQEAQQNFDEWTQTERSQWSEDDEEEWEEFHELYQIPDNKLLNISIEDGGLNNEPAGLLISDSVWNATAGAWAQSQGKGFLCSVEY